MIIAHLITLFSLLLKSSTIGDALAPNPTKRSVSIVTGSRGYLGRQMIHELLQHYNNSDDAKDKGGEKLQQNEVICLVREKNVQDEQMYWDNIINSCESYDDKAAALKVLPYDMLDGGETFSKALNYAFQNNHDNDNNLQLSCCVYHIASIFTPTEDHYQMALDNVNGAEDLMNAIVKSISDDNTLLSNLRVVLTSSTAAVRGPNQTPINGKWYTHKDWNTASEHGKNWGNSYQWSKAESERRAWDIAKENGIEMVSMCPSFIFGPPNGELSSSYSIEIVDSWIKGKSPVQSRLCVDIRDVAKAHRLAGTLPHAAGERFIVSSEARLTSQKAAAIFQEVAKETGFDPDAIHPDTSFDGGAIAIGDKEVEAEERLRDLLGLECRSVEDTMRDMARTLFEMDKAKII